MIGRVTLAAFLVGCGAAPAAWPPPLPAHVMLEADEPRVLDPTPDVASALDDGVPAAPETAAGDGDSVEVIEGELGSIRYLEMIFGDVGPAEPVPTIWIFHGRGDRARVPGGPFWGLPRPVRVFVPQGPVPIGEGFGWFPQRVLDRRTAELAAELGAMTDRLAAIIETLALARPTLGRPIIAGYSQGGHVTLSLALRHPHLFSFAFPSASWLPPQLVPELDPQSGFPIIRGQHTRDDERVPFEPTYELFDRLGAAGLDAELVALVSGGHTMTPPMDARLRAWLEDALERLHEPAPLEPIRAPLASVRPRTR